MERAPTDEWICLPQRVEDSRVEFSGILRDGLITFNVNFSFIDRRAQWTFCVFVKDAMVDKGFLPDHVADPTEHTDEIVRQYVLPSRKD